MAKRHSKSQRRRNNRHDKGKIGATERIWLAITCLGFICVFVVTYVYADGVRPEAIASAVIRSRTTGAGPKRAEAVDQAIPSPQSAHFTICHTGGGTNCVVDGDTVWVEGIKVRVADIDAPETHPPRCASEAKLGAEATQRLAELLNEGAFELAIEKRATDRYGRQLRILTRDGRSIGEQLVAEGFARPWDGARRPWC